MIRVFSTLRAPIKSHSLYLVLLYTICFGIVLAASPSASEKEAFVESLVRPRAIYLPQTRSTLDLVKRGEKTCSEKECPPCFDCHLSAFPCSQFGNCSDYDGRCQCPPGFGGLDCSKPREFLWLLAAMCVKPYSKHYAWLYKKRAVKIASKLFYAKYSMFKQYVGR
jgi:hypothetical protein